MVMVMVMVMVVVTTIMQAFSQCPDARGLVDTLRKQGKASGYDNGDADAIDDGDNHDDDDDDEDDG